MDGVKKEKDTTVCEEIKRREKISIIGALCEGRFFAPMVYQGYCTGKVIETGLQKGLLPLVETWSAIIMDKAPCRNSRKIR
jgi:hypothetical protein